MPFIATGRSVYELVACSRLLFGSDSRTFGKGDTRTQFGDGAICPFCSQNTPNFSFGSDGNLTFCLNSPAPSPTKRTSSSSPALPPAGYTALGRGKVPTCNL